MRADGSGCERLSLLPEVPDSSQGCQRRRGEFFQRTLRPTLSFTPENGSTLLVVGDNLIGTNHCQKLS